MEYKLENEDHTIGHLLQQELLRNQDVLFAGYIAPHPLEKFIKIRVQVKDGLEKDNISDIMNKSVKKIVKKIEKIEELFEKELKNNFQ